jgi:lipoate-protein ligase A
MSLKVKIITTDIQNPWINLALEEYFLTTQSKDHAALFLWQNKDTVVIGRNQNPWTECNLAKMEEDSIRLARRISGGGAVFHDIGNLNFSFIVNRDIYDVSRQCGVIINGLKRLGINACKSGRNDMTVNDKKFSGNAFCFRGQNALHHGTILIKADKEKMSKYLTVSRDKFKSKGIASVKSRVINLSEIKPDLTPNMVKREIIKAFEEEYGIAAEIVDLSAKTRDMWPKDPFFRDIMRRNGSWEWCYGEAPEFDITLKNRFTWGGIELYFKLDEGVIKKAEVYSDALCEEIISLLPGLFKNSRLGSDLLHKLNNSKKAIRSLLKDNDSKDIVLDDLARWLANEF